MELTLRRFFPKILAKLGCNLFGLYDRARQRRRLRDMEDWQLRDLNFTRAEALAEASKPFWEA